MRRLTLTLTVGITGLVFAAPAFAATTVSTPDTAPAGATVTVHEPSLVVPEDPAAGGEISGDAGEGVEIETRGVPDPLAVGPEDGEGDKEKKEKKDKDKD